MPPRDIGRMEGNCIGWNIPFQVGHYEEKTPVQIADILCNHVGNHICLMVIKVETRNGGS